MPVKFACSTIIGLAVRVTPGDVAPAAWGFTIPVKNPLMQGDRTNRLGAGTRA
jgi:hypothetical protein